ncbi:PPE domain-containing protein [Mycobacterium sp. M1]|uniref:PPE domain-containing protein n=1 Tax=Mycolicibacter acidiphilus TaxID=2835306 RepID=A0ABS5RF73_9MYCO|nr:PPE domain-containing protein [Mycolicibacter acidiphilus]MBS9532935.1 PPE domain-containing protein [Mycolicibacter acidiphilus]
MDFAAIPPEVNSIRMYSGPGSAPLRAAAAAWSGLAGELQAVAAAYESVIAELTEQAWLGPSSQALAAAVTPYVGWLSGTAGQAEQTAAQANAAAAAYDAAFAMTVPPSAVATNRANVEVLSATNVFGQHTLAIAALEALYGEMWAQDAAAMYGYAAAAVPAAQLGAFSPPPQTTRPDGPAHQAAATAQNAVGSAAQTALSQLAQHVAPAAVAGSAQGIEDLFTLPSFSDLAGVNVLSALSVGLSAAAWAAADGSTREILNSEDRTQDIAYDILHAIDLFSPLTPSRPAGAVGWSAPMAAGLGDALSVGRLSVPISWAATAPEIRSLSYTTPLAGPAAGAGAVPGASAAGLGQAFSQMGLAGMGGSALAGSVSRTQGEKAAVAAPQRVRAAAGAAGAEPDPDAPAPEPTVMGIAAEIREFADLRDRGLISADEYNEQKLRLLGR